MSTEERGSRLTVEQRHLIAQAAVRLKDEFVGTFSVETIERFMSESQGDLESRASVTTWLPVLIERFARERLRALARAEGLMDTTKPAVLFLCVHNAGRSQMAAGWLRHLAGDEVEVYSGGSEPSSDVNPAAIEAMAEAGVDIAGEFPRPWTDEVVRAADVVITMGCGDACPVYPGKRYEDWELTDPAGQPLEVVRQVRDDIEQRVRRLMAELEVEARV
jgi:protein-tyrosine-phosphatase